MKRFKTRILLLMVMVIGILSSVAAFAEDGIAPHWSYMWMVSAYMDVNDYNYAEIDVSCSCDPDDADSMKVTLKLQQYNGGWKTIETWNETINNTSGGFLKSTGIPKGYSYRNQVTVKAYKGSKLLETVTENFDYGYYN